jgi:hypothetical protein
VKPASEWRPGRHTQVTVCPVPLSPPNLPESTPSHVSTATGSGFPFEGELRVRPLEPPKPEPARPGEDRENCRLCQAADRDYVWVSDRWRVRATDHPTGLPLVLGLELRSHLEFGDLPNLLAAELGVMTVRLERAMRSLSGVAQVNVSRNGDDETHLRVWFFGRPTGRLQLRGKFLPLWDELLPPIPEDEWRERLGLVAAWLADFGGRAVVDPPRIAWQSLSDLASPRPDLDGDGRPG